MIDAITLDHVAVAFERREDAWARYGGELTGQFLGGGTANGFANYQIEFGNGMRLEVLEPARIEENDFLRRFLDRSGPGPHHLTFKVADITAALAAVEAAGYRPVGVSISFPWWKEMFLHPKEVPGVVIQIAEAHGGEWSATTPEDFPPPRTAQPAVLERIVHGVADLDDARRLFVDLLGGAEERTGDGPDGHWVDLAWPGAGRLRLLTPGPRDRPLAEWIGDRSGRLHHLAFVADDPAGVTSAHRIAESDVWEVAPEDNHGTRLRLRPTE